MPSFLPSIKWSRFPQSPFSPTRSDSTPLPAVELSQEPTEEVSARPLPGQLLVQNSSSTVALSSTPANGHSSQHQPSDAADSAVDEPCVGEMDAVPVTSNVEAEQTDEPPVEHFAPATESTLPHGEPASSVSLAAADPSLTGGEQSEESPLPEDGPTLQEATVLAPETLETSTDSQTGEQTNQESTENVQAKLASSAPQQALAHVTSAADLTESAPSADATPNSEVAPLEMNDKARAEVIKAELLSPCSGDADKENAQEDCEAADQSIPSPSEKKQKSKKNRFERMTSPLRSSGAQHHQDQEANPGLERALSGKRKNQVPIGDRLKGVLEQVKGKVKKDKEAVTYGKRLSRGELGV